MPGTASSPDPAPDTIPTKHNVNPYLMLLGRNGVLVLVGALEPIHGALLVMNNHSISGSLIGGLAATQELLDFCAKHNVLPSCEMVDVRNINTTFQRMHSFALWPLSEAAQSCYGSDSWPGDVPIPQAWIEFDVDNVERATAELESRGYRMLVRNKKEPWGQTVSRFIGPEGLLVGITFTPSMREEK